MCELSPPYVAVIAVGPPVGGVYWTEQLATPGEFGVGVKVQLAPAEKVPAAALVKLTVPVGVVLGGAPESPTVAVHVCVPEPAPAAAEHETDVLVARAPGGGGGGGGDAEQPGGGVAGGPDVRVAVHGAVTLLES